MTIVGRARLVRAIVAVVLVALLAGFWAAGWRQYLSLDWLKAQRGALIAAYEAAPVSFVAAFVGLQAAALTLLIPGAVAVFALAAGAIMGPAVGTLVVLVALTLGDSLGFLVARYLARDWAARRFGAVHARFERGMARGGVAYLLALRLAAFVPFFAVNVAMALTRMRLRVFAPVSFIGLAPATFLHVNAGAQLARIARPADVLTPPVIASFAALALFPLAMRWVLGWARGRTARAG